MESIVLRRKQVAALLNVSLATLWRWSKAGDFPRPVQLGPRSVGVLRSDLEAWIATRKEAHQ